MIIGTAGHIDHGKSTLVTALTGKPMDRLLEERRREITIELNFAPLDLGAGRLAGVVDVPGHEDFVRTMVAGASGIDLALLVIAGDEGIMPQTVEHLVILERLGVAAGIPVITKADLVDPDWLQLVMMEVAEQLQASPIAFDAPLAVSARTGAGMDTLRERLREHAANIAQRSRADGFRLPIDRVFSLPGVGTVVTGTVWSGSLRTGDAVVALPSGQRGRVRSLESFGRAVDRSEPGARTAVGVGGMERAGVTRGEVLVSEELPWTATRAVDVEIGLQPGAAPLRSRSRVRLLLGTAEVMARVSPRTPLEPGGTGMARLSLESPLVTRAEDRFVLRSYSPVTTIGGGRILDPWPPRRGSAWPPGLASADPAARFRSMMERRAGGVRSSSLPILLGLPASGATEIARREPTVRLLHDLWVATAAVEQIGTRALALLRDYHRQHPSDPGMPLETLRHALNAPAEIVEAALQDFARAGRLRLREGLVVLAGFVPRVAGGDAEIDRVVRILTEAHLSPPSVGELEQSTGRGDLLAMLRLAAARGQV
ncbi:MAG TPA: selenocysteine-specific translation elongation factor, partial [Gemmatimonadales bacterium]|nr:selenocysteine-specific translation elongation factor [Gemmatimonadales bacterium]